MLYNSFMKLLHNLKNSIFFLYVQIVSLIQLFFLRGLQVNSTTGLITATIFMCSMPFILLGFIILLLQIFCPNFKLSHKITNNKCYISLFYFLLPSTIGVLYNWLVYLFVIDITQIPQELNIKFLHVIGNFYYFWINPVLQ